MHQFMQKSHRVPVDPPASKLDPRLGVAQMPEYIAQAVLTGMLVLTGKWVSGLVMALLTAWNVRCYLRDEHKVGAAIANAAHA